VVEEIIGRLPELTESQLGRLEEELWRERQRRASIAGGGEGTSHVKEGGKRKKLYLGMTSDLEGTLVTKRAKPSGE
jgi:hypothetical protein